MRELIKHWFTAYLTSYYSEGKKLGLDVGSGYKNWHEFFKCEYLAFDLPLGLKQLKETRPDVYATACSIPFKDNTFDFLSCYSVLPQVDNVDLALDEMYRVMKPNSTAVFVVQNPRAMKLNKDQKFINKFNSNSLHQKLYSHNFRSIKHKNLKAFFYSTYYDKTSLYAYAIVTPLKI